MCTCTYLKGLERTASGKFEGGDAAWEEAKQGSYARSEVRLVEIQEKICADVIEGKDQCYTSSEQYESDVEEWWTSYQQDEPDLFKHLCIDSAKVCCPLGHFGSECTPCPGFPDDICTNNGKCQGAGMRTGSGKCKCDAGYDGELCDSCANAYFESYRDSNKFLCSKCHASCDGNCSKAGPTGIYKPP